MHLLRMLIAIPSLATALPAFAAQPAHWRPNDPSRPQPPVVRPRCAVLGLPPPEDAVVLFNGHDLGQWNLAGDPHSGWHVSGGQMLPGGHVFNKLLTREHFGSVQVHLEFREPYPARGVGQARGNSGVFLKGVYEVQIMDAYENPTYADGLPGAVYGQTPPSVLAVRSPGKWQSLDICFDAPRFQGAQMLSPPYVTVILNGILVQDHQEIFDNTSAHPTPLGFVTRANDGPLGLQDHGEATSIVAFRNIWIRPLDSGHY